jgi:hypothetical protein
MATPLSRKRLLTAIKQQPKTPAISAINQVTLSDKWSFYGQLPRGKPGHHQQQRSRPVARVPPGASGGLAGKARSTVVAGKARRGAAVSLQRRSDRQRSERRPNRHPSTPPNPASILPSIFSAHSNSPTTPHSNNHAEHANICEHGEQCSGRSGCSTNTDASLVTCNPSFDRHTHHPPPAGPAHLSPIL